MCACRGVSRRLQTRRAGVLWVLEELEHALRHLEHRDLVLAAEQRVEVDVGVDDAADKGARKNFFDALSEAGNGACDALAHEQFFSQVVVMIHFYGRKAGER